MGNCGGNVGVFTTKNVLSADDFNALTKLYGAIVHWWKRNWQIRCYVSLPFLMRIVRSSKKCEFLYFDFGLVFVSKILLYIWCILVAFSAFCAIRMVHCLFFIIIFFSFFIFSFSRPFTFTNVTHPIQYFVQLGNNGNIFFLIVCVVECCRALSSKRQKKYILNYG